jgi:hypothetical protein
MSELISKKIEEGAFVTNRSIGDVIDKILAVLPTSGTHVSLPSALHDIKDSASYIAPEMIGDLWHRLAIVLNEALPFPPVTTWQKEINAIVTNKKAT